MKKILLFLCLMVAIISISACSAEQDHNVLKVSKSSNEIVGENYQTVISELEETGFTNIETKVLDDLITGWLTKDGEIEQIEINGDTEFSTNDSFQKDSKIVITYHTFPNEEKSDTESTDDKSSETVEQSTNHTSAESNQEILTVKNNEDLAAVLAVTDENNPIISEFAKKYAGRTIEFDGNIAHMIQYEDYKTRYDILIYAGDYSETTFSGPSFKFEDVNVSDLKLTGSEIPENIGMGQNLRITAEVEEYNETSGLFFLKPISTEIR
ncbi:MAG: DUF4839 domain-containing protein [Bacillota bacterium]